MKKKEIDTSTIRKKIENGSIYRDYKYRRWRKRIFKRDGYSCQFPGCKKPKGSLNAHHILMKWYYPEKMYDIKNGITLCTRHHKKIHKEGSDNYIEIFQTIAAKNCKIPRISKKRIKRNFLKRKT